MIGELVKVDLKGRITIPATIRLLANINEGDSLLLTYDELSHKIVIHVMGEGEFMFCSGSLGSELLVSVIKSGGASWFTCKRAGETFNCKLIMRRELGESFRKVLVCHDSS